MRILFIHNAYQQRGGEESVVEAEVALLRRHGHQVEMYERDNRDVDHMSGMRLLTDTVWSRRTHDEVAELAKKFQPDITHVHNTFPLISPSAYWALSAARVPVVQTLHNFRQLCLQAMFLRDHSVCEDCLGHLPWRGVVRRCYRGSAAASSATVAMLTFHRALGSYREKVTRYIALSRFARDKFIAGGFPAQQIVVKPNFADVPRTPERSRRGGLFVGRLSQEKGIAVLRDAMRMTHGIDISIIGSGALKAMLADQPGVRVKGWLEQDQVYEHMRESAYLVLPSICYENFPRAVVEAFACALPVIATRLGAMAELIEEGRTGLLFDPSSPDDLAKKIRWAETNPAAMRQMGINARAVYEASFTPERNYAQLMLIYEEAIEHARRCH